MMDKEFILNDESSEDERSNVDSENEDNDGEGKLGISKLLADANYESAGTLVDEDKDGICVSDYMDLINPDIDSILDAVVADLRMPYMPSDFQRVTVNALGQLKNVVLVSLTGSGKMNVPLLATQVLKKKLNKGSI